MNIKGIIFTIPLTTILFFGPSVHGKENVIEVEESLEEAKEYETATTAADNVSAGSSAGVPVTPHIYKTEPWCFSTSQNAAECATTIAQARAKCPETFVLTNTITYVYHHSTSELLETRINPGYCQAEADEPEAIPITLSASDFQQLPLTPAAVSVEPKNLNGYVNLPVFFLTSNSPQTLTTTILGTTVLVAATPTGHTLKHGDTSTELKPTNGSSEKTITKHTFTKPGTYPISITTTWTGKFSVDNGKTWQEIDGHATTSTPANQTQQLVIKQSQPLLTG